jgi:hypothetical protein
MKPVVAVVAGATYPRDPCPRLRLPRFTQAHATTLTRMSPVGQGGPAVASSSPRACVALANAATTVSRAWPAAMTGGARAVGGDMQSRPASVCSADRCALNWVAKFT